MHEERYKDAMREQFRSITINFAPVHIVGIPGLVLVLIAIALAVQFPEARWLLLGGLAGGIAIATLLIVRRSKDSVDDGSDGMRHRLLTADEPPATRRRGPSTNAPVRWTWAASPR
jgi:hypothetical protein